MNRNSKLNQTYRRYYYNKDFTHISTCVKIDPSYDEYYAFYKTISKDLSFDYIYGFYCQNCGEYKEVKLILRQKPPHFCSNTCSVTYYKKEQKRKIIEFIKKEVSADEAKKFYQKFNRLVMYFINKHDKQYQDDLIDWWHENISYLCYKMRNVVVQKTYLKKCIFYTMLHLQRKKSKEVFISDLSMQNQIKIYGDVVYNKY